jgi:hypothetical protein
MRQLWVRDRQMGGDSTIETVIHTESLYMTGGGIGFVTARYSTYRTARAAAASKLRAAFIPELVAMKFDRNKEKFGADRLIRAAFPRHAHAV